MRVTSLFILVVSLLIISSCRSAGKRNVSSVGDETNLPSAEALRFAIGLNGRCQGTALGTQICLIEKSTYPKPVAVLIPPSYNGEELEVGIFFHGWSFGAERDKDVMSIIRDFALADALSVAKSKQVIVVPFSSGKNITYENYFRKRESLDAFLATIFPDTFHPKSITIIAHSGAFSTVGRILRSDNGGKDLPKIEEVALIDASYNGVDVDSFKRWLVTGGKTLKVSFLADTPTEVGAKQIWDTISGKKFESGQVNKDTVSDSKLEIANEKALGFGKIDHWEIVRKVCPQILQK